MGRRARTNCSPIDSAMEKYHNDIGSRLSGVFVPPQPCSDSNNSGLNPTDPLNMFTLDTRTKAHVQDNVNDIGQSHNSTHNGSRHERDYSPSSDICHKTTEKSQTLPSCLAQTPSSSMSNAQKTPESHSFTEDKEKRGLVDKLTRALFQRKHTCTRCQRKSRSCLPNKTFNSSEKHYMCGRCRETSHTMKNLVSGHSVLPNNSGAGDVVFPKPRIHLKDSGYETVTSCSTVASSHSNYNTNGSTKLHCPNSRIAGLSQKNNSGTPSSEDIVSNPNQQSTTHGMPAQTSYRNPTGLEQYMGVTRDDSPVRMLKQVKTRYVENYDGYLPNTETTHGCCVVKRPALPAFASPVAPAPEYVNSTCDNVDNARLVSSSDRERVHTRCRDTKSLKPVKACYTCGTTSKPCFRLPWEGGWLCEDCLDGVF